MYLKRFQITNMAFVLKIFALFVFLSIQISKSTSFLGSTELDFEGKFVNTRDHMSITKSALISVAMEFLYSHPEYLKTRRPMDFMRTIISHQENPGIVKKAMDNISPELEFINAMNEIQTANAEVDAPPTKHIAAAHFDGEEIKAGKKRLIKLKSLIISSLLQEKNFEHTRHLAGNYLHTLQDFYSRSNWIELGNTLLFDNLTNPDYQISDDFLASSSEPTCRSCTPFVANKTEKDDCFSNLVTRKLTSGYVGGQDVTKPLNNGKCSRGGLLDSSRFHPASGGINKDSDHRAYSPHHNYHLFATNLAVEASKEFFKGIREAVGDEKFAKFLNLKSDRSLALVIDVTGSMSEEIADVKRHSKKFIKQAVASGGSFTYILVPFSDPDVGPVTVTSDPENALKAVSKLKADGGGDCPEKGMTGLYEALLRSTKGSNVYYFSDADAKDVHREKEVLSLAKEKKISITFFITGKCPSRKRRAYQGVFLRTKRKTTATIKGLYERLASATGGQVFTISKKEVRTAIETIGALQTTSSSTAHKRKVLLLSVEENSALQVERVYHVSIDSTVKNILITLTASNIKQLLVTNVSGVSSKTISTHVVSQSNSLLALVARNISSGKVDLNISCFGPYNLQVTSQSQIDFSYQLRRVTKFGDIVPVVSGNIIQGQNLLLSFDLSGRDYIGNISSLSVIDKQANEVNTLSIKEGKGFHKGKYYALFIATVQTFRIKITGLDSNGAEFQRLKTSLINVGTTELKQVLDGYESIAVSPGDSTTLKFILRNKGKSDEFRIKASDDMSYTQDVSPHSVWLEQNSSVDINVTLQVNQGALHGTTATVTVSVEANSLEESASSFIVSYVSVAAKNPDLSPPKCVVLSQNSTCSTLEGLNCMSNTWAAHIQFKDSGKGLESIGLTGNSKGNLSVDAFSRGVSNSPVGAVYKSDCCHTEALVVGLDVSGNAGRCFISVATAGDALVTNISNIKRTLYKDEIIKIPFTVTNYGSPGLYTFEVSKANHIIGLISPFSVFLDRNETTEFQLSLTALEEAVYRRTVVAVKALKRISTANPRQRDVQLFDASLLLLSRLKIVLSTSSDQVVVSGGKSVTLAFRIKNLMDKVTFVLKVVTPGPHLIASFRPGLLTLQKNEMSKCSLTLTASNINLKEKVTLKVAAAQQLDSGEVLDPVFLSYLEVILVPEKKYDLSLLAPLPSREAKLHTGETTAINFTVINKGKAASIVFEVSVRGFFVTASVVPSRAKLHPNESLECHLEISSKEETTHVHNASIAVYAISSDYSRKTKSTTTFPLFKVGVLIHPVNRYNVTTWRNDSNRRAGIIAGTVTVILVLVALVIIVFAVKMYKVSHRSLNPRRGRHVKIRMTPENEDDQV